MLARRRLAVCREMNTAQGFDLVAATPHCGAAIGDRDLALCKICSWSNASQIAPGQPLPSPEPLPLCRRNRGRNDVPGDSALTRHKIMDFVLGVTGASFATVFLRWAMTAELHVIAKLRNHFALDPVRVPYIL
jgi:hypothetical protein